MKINTSLSLGEYNTIVEEIADGYFDEENGGYIPHIGHLNEIRLFYLYCVDTSEDPDCKKFPNNIVSATDTIPLIENKKFMDEFNFALNDVQSRGGFRFDFRNAHIDALDIVNNRKSGLNYAIDRLGKMLVTFIDMSDSFMSQGNLDKLSNIVSAISNGSVNVDKIVSEYVKAKHFSSEDNVVPIKKEDD